ncbi:4Fe-4S dicluster domain-containing protein [bacterium]|nr:4Fe-4S dicluster domain-containing protein [bacterium]
MRVLWMEKGKLKEFFYSMKAFGELWGPIQKGKTRIYGKAENFSDLKLEPGRTALPIKKLIHPSKFTMFKYDKQEYSTKLENIPRRVILGVSPCDIHGLLKLDEIFLEEEPDPYYEKRRDNTAIIGISYCKPCCDSCICQSMGTDVVDEGYDLFFSDLEDFYLVWVGSSLGDDLVRLNPAVFHDDIDRTKLEKFVECKKERDKLFACSIDMDVLPDIMELSYDSPIWDELGDKCLECGACTMVCPSCNCYNVIDEVYLSEGKGKRFRYWDCCIFKEYSLVAGDHNFRENRGERLRLWYGHKLNSFGPYGRPACVGCGRCVDACPVDINVLTVARALLESK